jgi:hypothetical protein
MNELILSRFHYMTLSRVETLKNIGKEIAVKTGRERVAIMEEL